MIMLSMTAVHSTSNRKSATPPPSPKKEFKPIQLFKFSFNFVLLVRVDFCSHETCLKQEVLLDSNLSPASILVGEATA
jgi:hypothetical protein